MSFYSQYWNQDAWLEFMNHPAFKGSCLGAGVMFLITPGVNRFRLGSKMRWSEAFVGWQPLVASGVISASTSFYVKDLLGGNQKNASPSKKFWTSAVAGAVSAIPLCPFEAVNNNHQQQASLAHTIRSIHKHHGRMGFFQGTTALMVRESAWVVMYMTAVASISQHLCQQGYDKTRSEAFALIFSACVFGFLSAPVNRLRVMKQENLTLPGNTPSYRQLAADMYYANGNRGITQGMASCFKGGGVRSLTSAAAGGLFFYGAQWWDEHVSKPSLGRRPASL